MDDLKTLIEDRGPLQAGEDEREALANLERVLAGTPGQALTVSTSEGQPVALTETARRLMRVIARSLARGEAVKVVPYPPMLSAFGIADLLNVSIAQANQLLDEGQIPFTRTELYDRRVTFRDLMAYKARRDVERREGLTELIRMTEALGLYEEDKTSAPAEGERSAKTASRA